MLDYYQNLEHLLVYWRSRLPQSSPYPFPLVLVLFDSHQSCPSFLSLWVLQSILRSFNVISYGVG